jgi:predicted ribosomally synthesized peptide with nif11-like leader
MAFIRGVREDTALAERVSAVDPAEGITPVLRIAADAGFAIEAADLQAAHAHDWALRRVAYATADSAASTVAVVNTASSST